MKSAFALLTLSTAIAISVAGVLTAAPIAIPDSAQPAAADAAPIRLAGNDHDDDKGWWIFGEKHERHEGREDDDDEDDDDGGYRDGAAQGAMNPAPAGNAAPPANGLFAPGAKPAVQVN
ncbi:MAG: hypothetical protein H5U24_16540 [Thioclava marina]|uniref:hypothetical protein n=1 Tax=Thioclava marina TaxID=1915077 RepID=UPI0019C4D6E3|nr:hypothetical protein [Thioclava marina]MBC7146989.1 hypothetical protein [Thioclava marina]